MSKQRSLEEANAWVRSEYETHTNFAKAHGFSYMGVQRVLKGQSRCLYGEGLAIAKILNLDLNEVRK